MSSIERYMIKKIELRDLDLDLVHWFKEVAAQVNQRYGGKFNWKNFPVQQYIKRNRLTVCFKNSEPIGLLAARLYPSVFDSNVVILFQDLLYARPGTRAAKLLLDDFIDFGKVNANHIITTIAEHTNVNPRSLERLGFKKLESKYRLEV